MRLHPELVLAEILRSNEAICRRLPAHVCITCGQG